MFRFLAVIYLLCSAYAHPTVIKRTLELAPRLRNSPRVLRLSQSEARSYRPFALFAQASYCPLDKVQNWTCPGACEKLPGFQPTQAGGDGVDISQHFVGFWPQEQAVVVVHEGSNIRSINSLMTDLWITKDALDPELFPGVSDDVRVHSGFAAAHRKTARDILYETRRLLEYHNVKNVLLIGHSLGGALAALNALSLTLHLPEDIVIQSVTFGMPRIGNQDFVNFFDEMVPQFRRVTNEKDAIPILPPQFLGFVHTKGEIHMMSDGSSVGCPGNDNDQDERCTTRDVPSIFGAHRHDHSGPFFGGVSIGKKYCGIKQPSFISGIVSDGWRKVKQAGSDAWDGIKTTFRSAWSWLTS